MASSPEEVSEQVEATRSRLDQARLRAQVGFQTAAAADRGLTPWYNVTTRERILATLCRRLGQALWGPRSGRAARRARRDAVHASLEELELVQRTRGGRCSLPSNRNLILAHNNGGDPEPPPPPDYSERTDEDLLSLISAATGIRKQEIKWALRREAGKSSWGERWAKVNDLKDRIDDAGLYEAYAELYGRIPVR